MYSHLKILSKYGPIKVKNHVPIDPFNHLRYSFHFSVAAIDKLIIWKQRWNKNISERWQGRLALVWYGGFWRRNTNLKAIFRCLLIPLARDVNQVENSKQKIRFYHSLVLRRTRFLRYLSIFVFWPSVPLSLSSNQRENIY